jgi:hypothetical protein
MNKISAFLLIAICVMPLTVNAEATASAPLLLHKREAHIKEYILKLTPLGSSSAEVLKAIKWKLGIRSAEYKKHYFEGDDKPPYREKYVEGRIETNIGMYNLPWDLFMATEVDVEWDFDARDKLRDVTVIKRTYGL